jgi:hypothetical protein
MGPDSTNSSADSKASTLSPADSSKFHIALQTSLSSSKIDIIGGSALLRIFSDFLNRLHHDWGE